MLEQTFSSIDDFGAMPAFFQDEDELSIDAEHRDLSEVPVCVAWAMAPLTRAERLGRPRPA